jgi:hypothetical protein
MLKPTATILALCLLAGAPAKAPAAAGIPAVSAFSAPLPPAPARTEDSPTEHREDAQPAPPAPTRHHPLRTLAIALGIILAAVLVAAVYLGHHN